MPNVQPAPSRAACDACVIFVGPKAAVPAWLRLGAETVRHVERQLLGALLVPMLARGPVVVVAPAEDGPSALAMGADEVVASDELSEQSLSSAVSKAGARFEGRRRRERHVIDLVRADDRAPFELFARAVAHLVADPLGRAFRSLDRDDDSAEVRARRKTEIERVEQLVEQLRSFGEKALDTGASDASLVVSRAWDVIAPMAERVATLTIEVGSEPCMVPMPAWQLTHAVLALVQNALESVSRGVEHPSVELRVLAEDDIVVVEVCDNGPAMDPEARLRALDPFYVRSAVGEGLGLSLVSVRARRAGGELLVDSLAEIGTAARIFLPRVRSTSPEASALERN
jgi:C4-dicarboxylate-specific signal transduction histidine kinase